MIKNQSKYIIIGAGLSGLTTAYLLQKNGETDFLILESRDRIGGRITSKGGIDFGAAWFYEYHHNVVNLLEDLKLKKFCQYNKGQNMLVYNNNSPAHYFSPDPNTPTAYRIFGGSSALINTLTSKIANNIKTNTKVSNIFEKDGYSYVTTNNGTYKTNHKVIITVPPRLSTGIVFNPKLPIGLTKTLRNTHTWMSNALKIGLTFKTPFWRNHNLSGTLISQTGALIELYDHTDAEEKTYALMGFVNEALRELTPLKRKEEILRFLQKYYGDEILDYLTYEEKDWSKEKYTSCRSIKSFYRSPNYGNSKFESTYFDGKLLFSGTETSPIHGGYMDGAIYSGILAARKILNQNELTI